MQKILTGVILTLASLLVFAGIFYWYNAVYTPNWMNQMMGGMMGSTTQHLTAPWYMLLLPFLLFIPLIGGVLMVGYFALYPEIRTGSSPVALQSQTGSLPASFESVMKTMKPEEQRLLEILKAHNGVYLQKSLRTESGLTRLKVHRIVSRLAERGIVTVREAGNSNEVSLADWLRS